MKRELIELPDVECGTLPAIQEIITALNVPREVLASDDEIACAWDGLPRQLKKIPPVLRNELVARMCVAISVGLFDGAINYIWNASIDNLRKKVEDFGFNVVGQLLQKKFEKKDLYDMKDAELLSLCLNINLISEEGFYFLNQCRDIRNNYSAAHPNKNLLDDTEVITYISRCAKYALSSSENLKGVDISEFMSALKESKFDSGQKELWITRLKNTNETQRDFIFSMLYGVYCGEDSAEHARTNAYEICNEFKNDFSPKCISDFLNRHYEYKGLGKTKRYAASQNFFERLGLIEFFTDIEKHNLISKACTRLMSVHLAMDNFYNEPPFAERIYDLTKDMAVPDTAKEQFVEVVITCYVGNRYGYCRAAEKFYSKIIENFSTKEIEIMLNIDKINCILSDRVNSYNNCKDRYKKALILINKESVPLKLRIKYNSILK